MQLLLSTSPAARIQPVSRQQLLELRLERRRILGLHLQREQLRRLGLERLDDPQQRQDEDGREHREQPHADAGRQADRQRRQHDAGILGIVDLRPVAHQPRGADDAERAREAGADDQHHDGADDGEDDLRLDDRRLALRRAFAARPQRQHARQAGGDRQPRAARAGDRSSCSSNGGVRSDTSARVGLLLLEGRLLGETRQRRRDKRGREQQDAHS